MNTVIRALSSITLCCAMAGLAQAQESPTQTQMPALAPPAAPADRGTQAAAPAKGDARSEAGEPRAVTSVPNANASEADAKAKTGRAGAKPKAGGAAAAPGKKSPAVDRLNLDTATVTGDREQPKVMYIVPWKKSDIGDLAARPMNSLVDEILAPVDRDVFKREVVYYQAVQSDATQNGAPPGPQQPGPQQVEK